MLSDTPMRLVGCVGEALNFWKVEKRGLWTTGNLLDSDDTLVEALQNR